MIGFTNFIPYFSPMVSTIVLYLGVRGKGLVCGIPLNRRNKDEFAQMVDQLSSQLIHPR